MLETIDPSVVYLDVGLLVAISSFTITDVWDKDTPFNFHTEPPATSFQDPATLRASADQKGDISKRDGAVKRPQGYC
jgi:hypothetical protein